MTEAAAGVDDLSQVPGKTTTTVALDFGRISIDDDLTLYLFGTPGQDRFGFMWNDIVNGALGALVIVDSRRMDECYPAVDYFEKYHLPFVVAVNQFDGDLAHDPRRDPVGPGSGRPGARHRLRRPQQSLGAGRSHRGPPSGAGAGSALNRPPATT